MSPVTATFNQIFSGRFLKAADITKPILVTISDVNFEPVGQEKEMKLVLSFLELTGQDMVCNKTNAGILQGLYGNDPNAWINQRVVMYVDPTVYFQGKNTPAIRLRPAPARPVVQAPQAAPAQQPLREEPPMDYMDDILETQF